MDILDTYLHNNGYRIEIDGEATAIYNIDPTIFDNICGTNINDTLDGIFSDEDEDQDVIKLLIVNRDTNEPVSIFYGTIEDDTLSSDYTCSSKLAKGGALLRFYALLLANARTDGSVKQLKGGISGGIPPILKEDSHEIVEEKTERLRNYHIKLGARLIENRTEFIYELPIVQQKIRELFAIAGGKRKRKSVKLRKRNTKKRNTRRYKYLK